MQIAFDISNHSDSPVSDDEIKSMIYAVSMCWVVRNFQSISYIKVAMQPELVEYVDAAGKHRIVTAAVSFIASSPNLNVITVSYANRTKSEVLASIFHEMEHLLAAINGQNIEDADLEEKRNYEQMTADCNLAEWLFIVLASHHRGTLESLNGNKEEVTNERTSGVVC